MIAERTSPGVRCGRSRSGRDCAYHRAAPVEPEPEPELYGDTYSPTAIGFWLVPTHYFALCALATGDGHGDEADYLAYEWSLIRAGERTRLARSGRLQGNNPQYCLCAHLHGVDARNPDSAYPQHAASSGGTGDARGRSARIKADLEMAADALPIGWKATRVIFAIQQRSRTLYSRIGDQRAARTLPRAQDADREPEGAFPLCLQLMARSLGWRGSRAAA